MEELLRYDHVDISYNGIPAVQDVSFTLRPGEILGIVGESRLREIHAAESCHGAARKQRHSDTGRHLV